MIPALTNKVAAVDSPFLIQYFPGSRDLSTSTIDGVLPLVMSSGLRQGEVKASIQKVRSTGDNRHSDFATACEENEGPPLTKSPGPGTSLLFFGLLGSLLFRFSCPEVVYQLLIRYCNGESNRVWLAISNVDGHVKFKTLVGLALTRFIRPNTSQAKTYNLSRAVGDVNHRKVVP